MEKIVIGSDMSGYDLKEAVKKHLQSKGFDVTDVGTPDPDHPVDFYDVALRLGKAVSEKQFKRGIVICGTGMGVSLIANKFKGVYCGLCESVYAVNRARTYNNINVLGMGGFFVAPHLGIKMVDTFLNTKFGEGEDEGTKKVLEKAYEVMESL
jgi:ribose 5-phosphate isomerase B